MKFSTLVHQYLSNIVADSDVTRAEAERVQATITKQYPRLWCLLWNTAEADTDGGKAYMADAHELVEDAKRMEKSKHPTPAEQVADSTSIAEDWIEQQKERALDAAHRADPEWMAANRKMQQEHQTQWAAEQAAQMEQMRQVAAKAVAAGEINPRDLIQIRRVHLGNDHAAYAWGGDRDFPLAMFDKNYPELVAALESLEVGGRFEKDDTLYVRVQDDVVPTIKW